MPEYRRFIAYFYEYIDGKKERNAGFAKVELRNGMWRILFRLTENRMPEELLQVYGFVREEGYLLGFPMGTLRMEQELGEEWAYQAETVIGHDRFCFSDLSGIYIKSKEGRCFLTVWDDEAADPNKFVLELPEKEGIEQASEIEEQKETSAVQEAEPIQNQEMSVSPEEKQVEAAAVCAAELKAESSLPEEILQKRRVCRPFSEEEFTDCVQMMPCDLIRLQQDGWQAGRSSFLQHGFYQYRHLLLGRRIDGTYVLGVPGITNPQEKYMAELFGYEQFKPAPAAGYGQGFGYWCRQLQKQKKESVES